MINKQIEEMENKIYIKIESNWVDTIFLEPKDVSEHLEEHYGIGRTTSSDLIDFATNKPKEKLTITAVLMTEEEFNKLPEWEA